jgi:hypothetical protein
MSLIYTSQLNDANPFDYLTQLQRHVEQVAVRPALWMPWNYRAVLSESHDRAEAPSESKPCPDASERKQSQSESDQRPPPKCGAHL